MLLKDFLAAWLTAIRPQVLPLAKNTAPLLLAPTRRRAGKGSTHHRSLHTSFDLPKRHQLVKSTTCKATWQATSAPSPFSLQPLLTYLDTFKAESQAAHPRTRSLPVMVRRGLTHGPCVVLCTLEGRRWERRGWVEMPQVREGSPSLVLGSGLNQTPRELLLCTHVQGYACFQHNPPIHTQPRNLLHPEKSNQIKSTHPANQMQDTLVAACLCRRSFEQLNGGTGRTTCRSLSFLPSSPIAKENPNTRQTMHVLAYLWRSPLMQMPPMEEDAPK